MSGAEACCQLVPRDACIDGTGTHRHLHEELIFHERDHAMLLSELPASAALRARTTLAQLIGNGSVPIDPSPITPVLVLDADEGALHGLPPLARLARWMPKSWAFKLLTSALPQTHGCISDLRARIRASRDQQAG